MPEPLSMEEVRHVARLARLRLDDAEMESCRVQLTRVLDHIAMLERLDVAGVEPLAHPLDIANPLANDDVRPSMAPDALFANAPAVEGGFLAVPKVLDGGESG